MRLALLAAPLLGTACVTQSSLQPQEAWSADRHSRISVEPCRSRAAIAPELEARATRELEEELADSGVFELAAGAGVIATCDIELFEEGSAFKRWIAPGLAPSLAQVAVTLWDQPGDHEIVRVRGKAAVREGGLYTIGADRYILSTALDEVVDQLVEWTRGSRGTLP